MFESEQSTSASSISSKSVTTLKNVRGDGLSKAEDSKMVQGHLGTDSAFSPPMWWSLLVLHLIQELREPGIHKHFLKVIHKVSLSAFFWLGNIIKIWFLPQPLDHSIWKDCSCWLNTPWGSRDKGKAEQRAACLQAYSVWESLLQGYVVADVCICG